MTRVRCCVVVGVVVALMGLTFAAGGAENVQATPRLPTDPTALRCVTTVVERGTGIAIKDASVAVRFIAADDQYRSLGKVLRTDEFSTDEEGTFTLRIPAELTSASSHVSIRFCVQHPGYASKQTYAWLSTIQKQGGAPWLKRIELCPGEKTTGRVLTPDGLAAVGVKLVGFWRAELKAEDPCRDPSSWCETVTDEEGRFGLVLPADGAAVLWLLPQEFAPIEHPIRDTRGDLGVYRLEKGIVLKGRVLDMAGESIAKQPVSVGQQRILGDHGVGPVGSAIRRAALTDANGEFAFQPLSAGKYRVRVKEDYVDPTTEERRIYPLSAVFYSRPVILEDDVDPKPVVVQAVPHVTITAQYLDRKGEPIPGHQILLSASTEQPSWSVSTENGSIGFRPTGSEIRSWSTTGRPDAHGKIVMRAPKGSEVVLHLVSNERRAILFSTSRESPLKHVWLGHRARLGIVDTDMPDLMIYHYPAPVVIARVAAEDGGKLHNVKVRGEYWSDTEWDWVNFTRQSSDGRYRSRSLTPDLKFTVTATADGYAPQSTDLMLPEGEIEEIELILARE